MQMTLKTHKPLQQLFPDHLRAAPDDSGVHFTGYRFPVAGQGTIAVTVTPSAPLRIVLACQPSHERVGNPTLVLDIGEREVTLSRYDAAGERIAHDRCSLPGALLEPGRQRQYWLSLDTLNGRLRYGKGEILLQLMQWEIALTPQETAVGETLSNLRQVRHVALSRSPEPDSHLLWPLPVVLEQPAAIVADGDVSLESIALNQYTVVANLPPACQLLYANVGGPSVQLDTPDFPDFAAAINHSILAPNGMCRLKLEAKKAQAVRDKSPGYTEPLENYLRVTIGPNRGDSPGSPYVMEIWPGGYYSSIHDHGAACAVIKVLHGDIWVELYPSLEPHLVDHYREVVFHQGETTYLTPAFFQVHRLRNHNPPGQATITIQCYRYPDDDHVHWEYFDYLSPETGELERFAPTSDWDFLEFKRLLKAEWEDVKMAR